MGGWMMMVYRIAQHYIGIEQSKVPCTGLSGYRISQAIVNFHSAGPMLHWLLSYWDKATTKLWLKNPVQDTILYTVPYSTDHPLIYKTHHRDCTNNNQHGE